MTAREWLLRKVPRCLDLARCLCETQAVMTQDMACRSKVPSVYPTPPFSRRDSQDTTGGNAPYRSETAGE